MGSRLAAVSPLVLNGLAGCGFTGLDGSLLSLAEPGNV